MKTSSHVKVQVPMKIKITKMEESKEKRMLPKGSIVPLLDVTWFSAKLYHTPHITLENDQKRNKDQTATLV